MADGVIYMQAGPEIGVASTKAFTTQLATLLMLTVVLARRHGLGGKEEKKIIESLRKVPGLIQQVLELDEEIAEIADSFVDKHHALFLGRGVHYPIAMEGALKLKEISYIHAEGYPAGEMKHGAISLIDKEFPTIALATRDFSYEKMVSNIQEVKARKGPVVAISSEGDHYLRELVDDIITVPDTLDILQPILNVIPLQLFAYHIADLKGREIDKPRNLAKSVTVE